MTVLVKPLSILYFIRWAIPAALIASSANMLQCSFTGGSFKCAAMSSSSGNNKKPPKISQRKWSVCTKKTFQRYVTEFLIPTASSIFFPFTHSVATEELAIADPQPKVLKTESMMLPFS